MATVSAKRLSNRDTDKETYGTDEVQKEGAAGLSASFIDQKIAVSEGSV
jgi:hypothetical protein